MVGVVSFPKQPKRCCDVGKRFDAVEAVDSFEDVMSLVCEKDAI